MRSRTHARLCWCAGTGSIRPRGVRGGERAVVLDAPSPLVDWYTGFGFAPRGRGFVEDGIPHTPMRRAGA